MPRALNQLTLSSKIFPSVWQFVPGLYGIWTVGKYFLANPDGEYKRKFTVGDRLLVFVTAVGYCLCKQQELATNGCLHGQNSDYVDEEDDSGHSLSALAPMSLSTAPVNATDMLEGERVMVKNLWDFEEHGEDSESEEEEDDEMVKKKDSKATYVDVSNAEDQHRRRRIVGKKVIFYF